MGCTLNQIKMATGCSQRGKTISNNSATAQLWLFAEPPTETKLELKESEYFFSDDGLSEKEIMMLVSARF
jgi:hypothetical protein